MAENIKSIQYIRTNNGDYSFDAVTIGGKSAEEIGDLVTSINGESTDDQYPSAKCIYEMIYGNGSQSQPEPAPHDYSQDYLTLEVIGQQGGQLYCEVYEEAYYSLDNGVTWTSIDATIYVNPGDKLLLKGYMQYGTHNNGSTATFDFNYFPSFNVYGNLASLCYGDNFANQTVLPSTCTFSGTFKDANVVSAENLILPFTELTDDAYEDMFAFCENLTTAPAILPADLLGNYCYRNMFDGCTSLTTPPVLPATTLSEGCYMDMFYGCTSLTTAPELPATTLAVNCYSGMFYECSSLNYIKCLATDISASGCTGGNGWGIRPWLDGVAQTGTFVKDSHMEDWEIDSYSGIPDGWTVEYEGTISEDSDYDEDESEGHDYSQNYLTYVILEDNGSLSANVDNVYASTDGGTTWTSLNSTTLSVNTGDRVLLKGDITYNASDTPLIECDVNHNIEGNMLSVYDSTGFRTRTTLNDPYDRFEGLFACDMNLISAENLVLPLTTLTESCYYRMFFYCTNLTTAPALPATTLTEYCYTEMFYGCTSLNHITCLATDISASSCTNYWVYGVAQTGTFVKDPNMTDWITDDENGIPTGWTVQNVS